MEDAHVMADVAYAVLNLELDGLLPSLHARTKLLSPSSANYIQKGAPVQLEYVPGPLRGSASCAGNVVPAHIGSRAGSV